jgi:hypothetical protein
MATILAIYEDDALTTVYSTIQGIISASVNKQLYAGSPDAGLIHQRKTLPGVNQLQVSLVDNDTGDIVLPANIKMALTEGGLAGAVAGASLNLGTSIESGVEGAVTFWLQYTDASGAVAEFPGALSLKILDVEDESA